MVVDSLAKLNRTSRYGVFGVLIIIATIATYRSIVAPRVGYLSAAQRYQCVVGEIAKKNETIGNMVKGRRKELEKLQEQCLQLEGALFSPEQAKEFSSDLRAFSEQAGCVVHSLRFPPHAAESGQGQSKDPSGIVAKRMELGLKGSYDNVVRLMERLQGRTQKVWIESLEIQSLNDGSNQLKCDIAIVIYTIPNEERPDE